MQILPSHRQSRQKGFSLVELLIVLVVTMIVLAIALPQLQSTIASYRLTGTLRSISSQLALARMRGASNFTKAQVNFDTAANTYQLEVWNKSSNSFQVDGGTFNLPPGVTFGFGGVTTPAGGQTSIAQTIPITFNSRGIPIDSSDNPVSTDAIYVGDTSGRYFALSVTLSGQIKTWRYSGTSWVKF